MISGGIIQSLVVNKGSAGYVDGDSVVIDPDVIGVGDNPIVATVTLKSGDLNIGFGSSFDSTL